MKVLTYCATSDQIAPSKRFVARIQHDTGEMCPVIFEGPNLAHLIDKAEHWWGEEVSRAEAKAVPRKRVPKAPEAVDEDFEVL